MKMHVSIHVKNLARSLAFYEAFFGTPPHKIRPGYANFDLAEPPLKFALTETPYAPGTGTLSHLGFQVTSQAEVEAAKARLQNAGLATFDEKDTTCCYALQDKIWVHDPDGNAWEVYVLLDDMLEDDHSDQVMPLQPPVLAAEEVIMLSELMVQSAVTNASPCCR